MAAFELYAFWRYDQFPYVLHGNVVDLRRDGCVRVEGYLTTAFYPLLLLPKEEGQKLGREINKLRAEHRAAREEFEKEWRVRLRTITPYPIHPPFPRDKTEVSDGEG